ncbi:MAG: DUF2066 domain-containing protein [Gammaproteobacteria bacterium]
MYLFWGALSGDGCAGRRRQRDFDLHFERFRFENTVVTPVRPIRLVLLYCLLLAALCVLPVQAANVPDLYAIEVPLEDRDDEEALQSAYALALSRVLVRVTGQRDIARDSAAGPIIDQADRFVQQFTYRGSDALWVAFDGPVLERAVGDAGLAVWNRDRPSILVWLAIDRGDGARALLGANDEDPVKEAVEAAATARGVALIWPLLDSADLSAASLADVWGGYGDNVEAASARYRPGVVLVGRLRGRAGQALYGNWDLQTGGDAQRYRGGAKAGIDQVADFLVQRLATSGSIATTTSLTVSGIRDVAAYSDTLDYLVRLSLTDNVKLIAVQDDTFVFEVDLLGETSRLRSAIDVGRMLVSDDPQSGSLSFRYAR